MAEFMYEEDDVDMPMFPVFALNNMAQGVTSVVPDMDFKCVAEVDAETILAQMHQHGVTTCTASPPFFDRLTERLAKKGRSAPALRRILTGGAPVTDAQLRRWQIVLPETDQMFRQRQLHKDAMDAGVAIEIVDKGQDIVLRCIRVKRMLDRMKAAGFGRTLLVANVNLARGVFPNNDYCESGR